VWVRNIVFSSTCAIYGYPKKLPVTEDESRKPVSVYGESKLVFEAILDWYEKLLRKKGILNIVGSALMFFSLYFPPNFEVLAGRRCHRLTYERQSESKKIRAISEFFGV